MGCVLCHPESRYSNGSSGGSIASPNEVPLRTKNAYEFEDDRCVEQNSDEYQGNSWARAHVKTAPYRNGVKKVESYCDWDSEQGDVRNERVPAEGIRHHQQRSYCSIIKKDPMIDPTASETRVNGHIVTECSRRPIRCPRLDCAVNVAFSALTHHFMFDHPEVPILSVEPGAKSTLIVSFAALSCNSSRCLALLLVSGKLS